LVPFKNPGSKASYQIHEQEGIGHINDPGKNHMLEKIPPKTTVYTNRVPVKKGDSQEEDVEQNPYQGCVEELFQE
jgi:hypothetical protein